MLQVILLMITRVYCIGVMYEDLGRNLSAHQKVFILFYGSHKLNLVTLFYIGVGEFCYSVHWAVGL